jgi:hypothetical protein
LSSEKQKSERKEYKWVRGDMNGEKGNMGISGGGLQMSSEDEWIKYMVIMVGEKELLDSECYLRKIVK